MVIFNLTFGQEREPAKFLGLLWDTEYDPFLTLNLLQLNWTTQDDVTLYDFMEGVGKLTQFQSTGWCTVAPSKVEKSTKFIDQNGMNRNSDVGDGLWTMEEMAAGDKKYLIFNRNLVKLGRFYPAQLSFSNALLKSTFGIDF